MNANAADRLRRLQLRARRLVRGAFAGEYRSTLRGAGMIFEDVRPYSPGDDVRNIDWNVTARSGEAHVKRFREERDRTLLIAVAVHTGMDFGTRLYRKAEVALELAALFAYAAELHRDRVGLFAFAGGVEQYVPPAIGPGHVARLTTRLANIVPTANADLPTALARLERLGSKRGTLILISDFHDLTNTAGFARLARRHDLLPMRVIDPCEESLPNVGRLQLGDTIVNTGSATIRAQIIELAERRREAFAKLCARAGVPSLTFSTDGTHVDVLIHSLRQRGGR